MRTTVTHRLLRGNFMLRVRLARHFLALGLTTIVFVGLFGTTSTSNAEDDSEKLYARALKSTVWIIVPQGNGKAWMGSGSLIDAEKKLILTNHHVIAGKDNAKIQFPVYDKKGLVSSRDDYFDLFKTKAPLEGKVLFSDVSRDLAIIQIQGKLPPGVVPIRMADKLPGPGGRVHSIGSPGASGALWVYTPGQVRAVYRKQWRAGEKDDITEHDAEIVETNSATNSGDSGGPLFNDRGELVAVTQGGISAKSGANSFSYFISVNEVRALLVQRKLKIQTIGAAVASAKDKPAVEPGDETDMPKAKEKTVVPSVAKEEKAEKDARVKLDLAQSFIDSGLKPSARQRLNEILVQFPMTKAATEAKVLLEKIK